MSGKRQNIQLVLAFPVDGRGEAPEVAGEGTEPRAARRRDESPARDEQWMERACERDNCKRALARVRGNRGSPGVDGMTVDDLPGHLREHWPAIREQLLSGTYRPQPVRRVYIPKPGGGRRKLGIPTVLDRFVQQLVAQVLQEHWDRTFSEHSYGFRPRRSAHQAVKAAQRQMAAGRRWVVDLDLEKFFDRVNHDRLMARMARRIGDKRMLKLIRAFLTAGVMEDGLVSPVDEGTPQGGPLSPFAVEHRARRTGPGVGATRAAVRTVRGRLQHLCEQSPGRGTRDGKRDAFHHRDAPLAGEPEQERGGAAMGAEVPRLQPSRHTASRSGGLHRRAVQRFRRRVRETDATDSGREPRTDGRGSSPLLAGMARLFREVRNAIRAGKLGTMDPATAAVGDLEAMETRETEVRRATPLGRACGTGRSHGWQRPRPLALGRIAPLSLPRPAERLLRLAGAAETPCSDIA